MDLSDIVVVDTETTGPDPEGVHTAIVQIAAYNCGTGDRFSTYCHPGDEFLDRMGPDVMAITTITPKLVREQGIGIADALLALDAFVGDRVVAGHNYVKFDHKMLAHEASRRGVELKLTENKIIDTMRIAMHAYPPADWTGVWDGTLPNYKLGTCFYGIVPQDGWDIDVGAAHDALFDSIMTARIIETWADTGLSVEDMIALTEAVVIPKVLPFGKYKGAAWGTVPDDYLTWLVNNLDNPDEGLTEAIVMELGRRGIV